MLTLVEQPSGRTLDPNAPLSLEDYLSLPDDTRMEIVEGILRPMTRATTNGRQVQGRLYYLIEAQCPPAYLAALEEIVVLQKAPPEARIPDVSVFARAGKDGDTNHVAVEHMLLAVEIVSPGSGHEDRQLKPWEYAQNGIPHFWRIELKPQIAVHTYVLTDGEYVNAGVFGPGDRITSVVLGWVDISVDQLLAPR